MCCSYLSELPFVQAAQAVITDPSSVRCTGEQQCVNYQLRKAAVRDDDPRACYAIPEKANVCSSCSIDGQGCCFNKHPPSTRAAISSTDPPAQESATATATATRVAVKREPTTGTATGVAVKKEPHTVVSMGTCYDTLRLLPTSLIMNDPRSQVKSDILAQLKALADSS